MVVVTGDSDVHRSEGLHRTEQELQIRVRHRPELRGDVRGRRFQHRRVQRGVPTVHLLKALRRRRTQSFRFRPQVRRWRVIIPWSLSSENLISEN
ncbi:hypothetical protein U1Q18_024660 [Sarracenia purpurea var. burkii]